MAINKCKSRIYFKSEADIILQPFRSEREDKAFEMFCEGKSAIWPNHQYFPGNLLFEIPGSPLIAKRFWIDRVAAQEFIDWVVERAKTYNIKIDLNRTYITDQLEEHWIDHPPQIISRTSSVG